MALVSLEIFDATKTRMEKAHYFKDIHYEKLIYSMPSKFGNTNALKLNGMPKCYPTY